MSEHIYIRATKDGGWDIDNADHVDASGKQIRIASEIKTAFPGKFFTVSLNGTQCFVDFDDVLLPAEIVTLDALVATHKAIDTITRHQNIKIKEIDGRTGELIGDGFVYGCKVFSLSGNAQRKMIGTHEIKDHPALVYPVEWNTKDDLGSVLLSDAAELDAFYLTGLGTMRARIDSGTLLKRDVRNAVTKAEVHAVVDNR